MDHSRRLRRLEVHEGRHRHQQPRGQRAPLHVERGHRLHDELRPRRAHGLLRRHRPRRHVRAVGQQHGRDAPGPVLPPPRAAAEEPRRQDHRPRHALDADQHGRRPEHPLQAPDRPRHRECDLPRDHPHRFGERGLRARLRVVPRGQDQYRLRPGGQGRLQGRAEDHHARALPRAPGRLFRREGRGALRRARARAALPGFALRGPEAKSHEPLVHGLQPALAGDLDQ